MYTPSMRFLFLAVSIICIFFTLLPAAAQTQEELFQSEENETIINPCFPVLPLIQTTLEGTLKWHPDFLPEIPPDSFFLHAGKAESIQLEIGSEHFICEWNDAGQLVQFPLLNGTLIDGQGSASVHFNQAGEIEHITLKGSVQTDTESGLENETFIEIEIMEREDGEVSLARIYRDAEYYFVVFQYRSNYVTETWYNADGSPEGLLVLRYTRIRHTESHTYTLFLMHESIRGNEESRVNYDYDSLGNISNVHSETVNISVLYNDHSMPKYLEKTFLENSSPGSEGIPPAEKNEHVTFQWDERDLLVSLKGNFEDMIRETQDENASDTSENAVFQIAEKRFEYTLDDQGNWTERNEILMIRQGSYLFPYEGLTIRRTIQYSIP